MIPHYIPVFVTEAPFLNTVYYVYQPAHSRKLNKQNVHADRVQTCVFLWRALGRLATESVTDYFLLIFFGKKAFIILNTVKRAVLIYIKITFCYYTGTIRVFHDARIFKLGVSSFGTTPMSRVLLRVFSVCWKFEIISFCWLNYSQFHRDLDIGARWYWNFVLCIEFTIFFKVSTDYSSCLVQGFDKALH